MMKIGVPEDRWGTWHKDGASAPNPVKTPPGEVLSGDSPDGWRRGLLVL